MIPTASVNRVRTGPARPTGPAPRAQPHEAADGAAARGRHMTMRADSSNIAQYRELTQMVDFVETEWGFDEEFDGPTFLWDPTISSCSQHSGVPVRCAHGSR